MRHWLPVAVLLACAAAMGAAPASADWDAKQLRAVRSAANSLRQAVLTAEHELKGRAFSAVTVVTDAGVTYTVRVDTGDKAMTVVVDAKTGKVGDGPAASATTDTVVKLKEFGKLKGTLLAAMKAAEATAKGKSYYAAFKRVGNKDLFEVDIAARDDTEKEVVLDAASGKIRKVAQKTVEPAEKTSTGAAPQTGDAQ